MVCAQTEGVRTRRPWVNRERRIAGPVTLAGSSQTGPAAASLRGRPPSAPSIQLISIAPVFPDAAAPRLSSGGRPGSRPLAPHVAALSGRGRCVAAVRRLHRGSLPLLEVPWGLRLATLPAPAPVPSSTGDVAKHPGFSRISSERYDLRCSGCQQRPALPAISGSTSRFSTFWDPF